MRRAGRIGVVLAVLALAGGVAWALARAGSASTGPLTDALDATGRAVSAAEHGLVELFRGPGRAARLEWLEPYRDDPGRLADPDRILLGAYEERVPGSLEGIVEIEEALDVTFPLMHAYVAWGDLPRERFPHDWLRAVRRAGSLPVLSWEPWLTDFDADLHPGLPPAGERAEGGLRAVARGDYDFYVDRWARQARSHGGPILLRFAHEMNDPYRYPWGPQNNSAEDFVAAWRHVVERFRAAGADNVLWVWSPHPAYGAFDAFYPGDGWVDWVGATVLNYGDAAPWSRWWSFGEIFGERYEDLAAFGKPIMIAELGSLAVGGDRAGWYREALASLPDEHPRVRAVLYYASASDATVTGKSVDWSVTGDSAVVRAITEAMAGWGAPGGGR